MSNPTPNFLPNPDDDARLADDNEDLVTGEVDGDTVLDQEADPDLIDSADADRLAAEEGTVGEVPAGNAGADSGAADAVQIDPDDEAGITDISETNDTPGVGTRRE